jgi:hypothetical protein
MKVNAEICVLKPEDTINVVETLIENGCAVVIRANAHDVCNPTIFVHAYGEYEYKPEGERWRNLSDHFEQMVGPVGGGIMEAHEGHEDTMDAVVPPVGLQYAIDVFDDENDTLHRISCAEYSRDRAFKIAIEAAGRLANSHGKSVGNALARRILLMALGPIGEGDVDEASYAPAPSKLEPVLREAKRRVLDK